MLVLLQLCVCQLLCTGDGAFSNGQDLQPQAVPVLSGAFPLTFFLRSFLPHNNRSIFQLAMLILPYDQKVTDSHYGQPQRIGIGASKSILHFVLSDARI